MRCKDAKKKMDAWIDGELSQKERMLFENHIEDCPACSKEAGQLQRLTDYLCVASSPRPSAELEKRILAEFSAQTDSQGLFFWWISLDWKMRTVMAASVVIGLGTGYKLGSDWIAVRYLAQYSISGFIFSAGDFLSSWL